MSEGQCAAVPVAEETVSDIKRLKDIARQTRIEVLCMLTEAGSGHIGGCLSCVDIVVSIFFMKIRMDAADSCWVERDRFVLSKGHAAPVLYSVLARRGCIDCDLLMGLRKWDSPLQGHPCARLLPAAEVSTGSLGQGLSVSNGIALGLKLDNQRSRVYCLLGDGEMQEGQVWEAAMASAHYRLDNLCAIIDYNKLQIDGRVDDIMRISPVSKKWEAFGWNVMTVNGHDFDDILAGFNAAEQVKGQPTLIIANTVKGKGVSFYEDRVEYHGVSPTKDELKLAVQELKR